MKIAIFYDALLDKGGVPSETRSILSALSVRAQVLGIASKLKVNTDGTDELNSVCETYGNTAELKRILRDFKRSGGTHLLVVGLYPIINLFVMRFAKRIGLVVGVQLVSQMMPGILEGRIFRQFPDVRSLERKTANITSGMQGLGDLVSAARKRLYLLIFKLFFMRRLDIIVCFSSEESRQFLKSGQGFTGKLAVLTWGGECIGKDRFFGRGFSSANGKISILYWGRLDWKFKGISNLLEAVACAKHAQKDLPFQLFLAGPDYNGSVEKIEKFIVDHDLSADVIVKLPGSYEPGDLTPLRDTHYTILAPVWDGFPRALRESLNVDTPILVNNESHFADVVSKFRCGYVLENARDAREYGQFLIGVSNQKCVSEAAKYCQSAAEYISWDKAAERFLHQLENEDGNGAR